MIARCNGVAPSRSPLIEQRRIGIEQPANTREIAGFGEDVDLMIRAGVRWSSARTAGDRCLEPGGNRRVAAIAGHLQERVAVLTAQVRIGAGIE